jgi:hypothetical protein
MRRWVVLGFGCAVLALALPNLVIWLGGLRSSQAVFGERRGRRTGVVGGLITESISSVGT